MNRALLLLVMVVGCGGSDKPAENASSSAGDCPAGMVKEGGDCVAPEGQSGPGKPASTSTATSTSTGTSTSTSGTSTPPPQQEKTAYDREAVEVVLKRAAGQVKSSCGSASDDTGKATGPWGTTKASVRLGRNGHVRGVDVPAPYADKPVGTCVVHAFQNLVFPPYAAPADVTVDWDIELVKPK